MAWLALAATARADDVAPVDDAARAKARSLGYAGVEAYDAGDYAAASAKLEESFQLLPAPSLGLWSARSLVQLGRWVQAEERFRAVAALTIGSSDSPVQQQAKDDAQRERAELLRRIPSLKVRIVGAGVEAVTVSVDGSVRSASELATALLVDPGRHEISGVRGGERSQVVLTLAERAHEEVELRFSGEQPAAQPQAAVVPVVLPAPDPPLATPSAVAAPPPVDDTRRALHVGGWVAVGAGAAGLTTSLVSYILANQQYESFQRRDLCVNGGCSQDEVDNYNTLRDVQRISLIAGGALLAAGATVLVLTWDEPREKPVRLELGWASATLRGVF